MSTRKPPSPVSLANLKPFKEGNPGRPKGARNKLGEAFVEALHQDFSAHGIETIERVRVEEPAQYVRVIASLLPKEVKLEHSPLAELPDEELARLIDVLRAAASPAVQPEDGTHPASGTQKPH